MPQSNTSPLKKSGLSIIFGKNSPAKKFRPPEISAPVNYDEKLGEKENFVNSKVNGNQPV